MHCSSHIAVLSRTSTSLSLCAIICLCTTACINALLTGTFVCCVYVHNTSGSKNILLRSVSDQSAEMKSPIQHEMVIAISKNNSISVMHAIASQRGV
jgi:hypothetical protein